MTFLSPFFGETSGLTPNLFNITAGGGPLHEEREGVAGEPGTQEGDPRIYLVALQGGTIAEQS